GLPPAWCDRLSALVGNWEYKDPGDSLLAHLREAGCDPAQPAMRHFADLWTALQDLPRHLGQHSGGMVICQGRLDSCVPLEPATMPGRSVVQWDKDDCASMGIIKVDLLGLGMMALLEDAIGMIRRRGGHVDLAHLPPDDPTVYAMLQKADTVGVFQVESCDERSASSRASRPWARWRRSSGRAWRSGVSRAGRPRPSSAPAPLLPSMVFLRAMRPASRCSPMLARI